MKSTLVQLYQHRMDRCQSEQVWAIAAYAGLNAFVISHAQRFTAAIGRGYLLAALGVVGALVIVFTYERLDGYYNYRNQIAELVKDEAAADEFIKKRKSIGSASGVVWLIVFIIAVALPYLATVRVTGPTPATPPADVSPAASQSRSEES